MEILVNGCVSCPFCRKGHYNRKSYFCSVTSHLEVDHLAAKPPKECPLNKTDFVVRIPSKPAVLMPKVEQDAA